MELSARKRAVLAAIIRTYIETGEPVGSKILTELMENAPSSATLRNEMSELCELGLLEQPHTSAGRIPTSSGLHLYVNSLMKPAAVHESTKRYIDSLLPETCTDYETLPERAAQALCGLTGFPAVYCYTVGRDVTVRRVGLAPLGNRAAMLYLVTSDGRARSRICRLSQGFSPAMNDRFREIADRRIRRTPLHAMNKAHLQNVIAASGIDSLELMPLMTAVFEMAADAAVSPVGISGAAALYGICGEDGARRLLALTERRDPLLALFEGAPGETAVIFGNESGYRELRGATVAVSRYKTGNRYCGRIGVIGPNRMAYEQIIPSIEYTASRLTGLMTGAEKDMED